LRLCLNIRVIALRFTVLSSTNNLKTFIQSNEKSSQDDAHSRKPPPES